MKLKNKENNAIGNPKYSRETNDKVDSIIRRAISQSYPHLSDGERAFLITYTRTYTAENIDEVYDLAETGMPESLIESIIILALSIA